MADFKITILGCGSALPTTRHYSSAQAVNHRNCLYLIDCGEGTQIQLRRMHLKFGRLSDIFISHIHGDHCFGLPGLISTLGMLGRTQDLTIHAPKEIDNFLFPVLNTFAKDLHYKVHINHIDPFQYKMVLENPGLEVYSIPLKHRIPTCGFLFREKPGEAHLIKETIDFYQIPIKLRTGIKQGNDYITPEGEIIPNHRLTRPAPSAKSFAYCSDTLYSPEIVPLLSGVDLLYHEATFSQKDKRRAQETFHSTATQAAEIALAAKAKKLILGHFSARYEDEEILKKEAQEVFPNTVLANEGLVFEL